MGLISRDDIRVTSYISNLVKYCHVYSGFSFVFALTYQFKLLKIYFSNLILNVIHPVIETWVEHHYQKLIYQIYQQNYLTLSYIHYYYFQSTLVETRCNLNAQYKSNLCHYTEPIKRDQSYICNICTYLIIVRVA